MVNSMLNICKLPALDNNNINNL